MRPFINMFFAATLCFFSCSSPEMETAITHQVKNSSIVDSIAIGNTPFGIDRTIFVSGLAKPPIQNKMTEPQFDGMVTEIEMSVTIGTFAYKGYYYFDSKDRLYKINLQYQNEERLVRSDHDKAYENLHNDLRSKYGEGTSHSTMPGLKSVVWNFKNKKIELTGSCLVSNCSMECNIIETNLFEENTIQNRVSSAKLHLELKLHPEKF